MRLLEAGAGVRVGAQAILVGHDDQPESVAGQFLQRRKHAGHEADLLQAVDLFVRRFLDQGAVVINE